MVIRESRPGARCASSSRGWTAPPPGQTLLPIPPSALRLMRVAPWSCRNSHRRPQLRNGNRRTPRHAVARGGAATLRHRGLGPALPAEHATRVPLQLRIESAHTYAAMDIRPAPGLPGSTSLRAGGTVSIPTEPIGSIPRPAELIEAAADRHAGRLPAERFNEIAAAALRDTIRRFEATESPVITDGEQTKSSFAT